MKKIVVVSDSHGDNGLLSYIARVNNDALLFLHCGDSQSYEQEIYPFITIKGNNDYFIDNEKRIITIDNYKMLMIHGHKNYLDKDNLARLAKKDGCNVILYGHTHKPFYEFYKNVHILNPGALAYPRFNNKTYAIITIDDNKFEVNFKEIN